MEQSEGEDRLGRGRHSFLLASDIRKHRNPEEAGWPAADEHIEVEGYGHSREAAVQTADAALEEAGHNFPEEDRSFLEVVNYTGPGAVHNCLEEVRNYRVVVNYIAQEEDHSCLGEDPEEVRHSFRTHTQSQDLGQAGNLLLLRDAVRHRSGLAQDSQT